MLGNFYSVDILFFSKSLVVKGQRSNLSVHKNLLWLNAWIVMPRHAMHRIHFNRQSLKKKKSNQKNQNTPQDKKFFLNQILFVNSAK